MTDTFNKKAKTGGRTKGTPNKRTRELAEIFDSKNFCVAEKILELIPVLSPEKQADVLTNLMGYIYPKRKAIEQVTLETNLIDIGSLTLDQAETVYYESAKRVRGIDLRDKVATELEISRLLKLRETRTSSHRIIPKKD